MNTPNISAIIFTYIQQILLLYSADYMLVTGFLADTTYCGFIDDSNNRFKTQAVSSTDKSLIRLNVCNGIFSDQAVIYFSRGASNKFDDYDSPKQFNNSASVAEIFTLSDNEELAINGLNNIDNALYIPLGFKTETSDRFTIRAAEVSNFDPDVSILLRDNLLQSEFDLTYGNTYSFSSDATNSTERFTVLFMGNNIAAGLDNTVVETRVYVNREDKIVVSTNGPFAEDAQATIYDALGKVLLVQPLTNTITVIHKRFTKGVYLVTVKSKGIKSTYKAIVN